MHVYIFKLHHGVQRKAINRQKSEPSGSPMLPLGRPGISRLKSNLIRTEHANVNVTWARHLLVDVFGSDF